MSNETQPHAAPGWYDVGGTLRYYDGWSWRDDAAPVAVGVAPPVGPGWGATPYAGSAPTNHGPNTAVHWIVPVGRTWQSIIGGYVALFSLLIWILGPVALGLGIWAISASQRGHGAGRGRAVFAIVVGALTSAACVVFVARVLM